MDSQPPDGGPAASKPARDSAGSHRSRQKTRRTPSAYRLCDGLSEALIYLMVVFAPWAFGATQPWAIWSMNFAGYTLGVLLAAKWLVCWRTGFTPATWTAAGRRWLTVLLAGLTVLILGWCLVSALNARAEWLRSELRLEYREGAIPWLPHTYDAPSTWAAFWNYLALAAAFWAVRDWLRGKTHHERHAAATPEEAESRPPDEPEARLASEAGDGASGEATAGPVLPARLRRLLWVLCLNGALLALEGMLQRLEGTNQLLWLIEPRINKSPEQQFGPYAYRSNAAQYLNLIWPLCLALWWHLRVGARRSSRETDRVGASPHLLLLPSAMLMAVASFVSGSRGGATIAAGSLVVALGLVLRASRGQPGGGRMALVCLAAAGCVAGGVLGWHHLASRLFEAVYKYPTGLDAPLTEATLHCRFTMPAAAPIETEGLVGLSGYNDRLYGVPGSLLVCLVRDGLVVFFWGNSKDEYQRWVAPGFVQTNLGKTVDLTLSIGSQCTVYLDGTAAHLIDTSSPQPPAWTNGVAAKQLWVGRAGPRVYLFSGRVLSASLYRQSLSEAEVRAVRVAAASEGAGAGAGVGPAPDRPPALPVLDLQLPAEPPRKLTLLDRDNWSGRAQIYDNARQMAQDFRWLGAGPGAFGILYNLYRADPRQPWAWYLHDDWLEFRVTFGLVGFSLLLAGLGACLARWFVPGGLPANGLLAALLWLALGGCLFHAKFDFPFQIYSVAFTFLLLLCIASLISRRPA